MTEAMELVGQYRDEPIGFGSDRTASSLENRLGNVERYEITDREVWSQWRGQVIGASDVASICGVGRRTALAVWAEKTGRVPRQADSAILRRGRWFEAAIWKALADERPEWTIRPSKIWLMSPSMRLGATPDALAVDNNHDGILLIQGKVVNKPAFVRDWLDNDTNNVPSVPLGYRLQTLTEAMLVAQAYGQTIHPVIVALVTDTFTASLEVIPVDRHPGAEAKILDHVEAFWRDFDAGRQPVVDPARDADTIKALYTADDGDTVDLTTDNSLPCLMDERTGLLRDIKALEKRKEAIETEIRDKIGKNTFAKIAGDRLLSLKTVHNNGYTRVVEPYSYRVLREVTVNPDKPSSDRG